MGSNASVVTPRQGTRSGTTTTAAPASSAPAPSQSPSIRRHSSSVPRDDESYFFIADNHLNRTPSSTPNVPDVIRGSFSDPRSFRCVRVHFPTGGILPSHRPSSLRFGDEAHQGTPSSWFWRKNTSSGSLRRSRNSHRQLLEQQHREFK